MTSFPHSESEFYFRYEFMLLCEQIMRPGTNTQPSLNQLILAEHLINRATFPENLVSSLYRFTVQYNDTFAKTFPDAPATENFMSMDQYDKSFMLGDIMMESYKKATFDYSLNGGFFNVEFAPLDDKRALGRFDRPGNTILLSPQLHLVGPELLLTTALKQAGQAIVFKELNKKEKQQPIETGLEWLRHADYHTHTHKTLCPLEGLVRKMAAFGAELIAPNSAEAEKIARFNMSDKYPAMKSVDQFNHYIATDHGLKTHSLELHCSQQSWLPSSQSFDEAAKKATDPTPGFQTPSLFIA